MNNELKPLVEAYVIRMLHWRRGKYIEGPFITELLRKMNILLNHETSAYGLCNVLKQAGIQNRLRPTTWWIGFEKEDIELAVIKIMSLINI